MNIQARLKQAEERAMLLQKKADTIHLIMVKPVPGKERLYVLWSGEAEETGQHIKPVSSESLR